MCSRHLQQEVQHGEAQRIVVYLKSPWFRSGNGYQNLFLTARQSCKVQRMQGMCTACRGQDAAAQKQHVQQCAGMLMLGRVRGQGLLRKRVVELMLAFVRGQRSVV